MKNLLSALVIGSVLTTSAQSQVKMPQASPTQTIKQDFGMGEIELTYSRPSLKGRKVFGDNTELAPLGKMWRTGANGATKIKFTDKVTIGGKAIDTGTYVLYTIPNKGQWEIILNKGLTNWGTDGYTDSLDVVRCKVMAKSIYDYTETFSMQFGKLRSDSCELTMNWGFVSVSIPITTNIKDRLRRQIEEALKGDKKPYQQAANFYYEWDKNLPKALENIKLAIAGNPKAFWMYLTQAKIQRDMGDKEGARSSAEKTIEIATAEKNDDYVKMAKALIEKL